jgi:hexosaminidase
VEWFARTAQEPGEETTVGGYYTQEEIKEVVAYAESHFINIVPEIELPAHVSSVLTAYPEYSCTGGPHTIPPGGIWPTGIYCAGKDSTFSFLEDVLSEVIELFPYRYIHIGGDEASKDEWEKCPRCQQRIQQEGLKDENELQSYFIKRVQKFLNSNGRKLIGWDEIIEGGLAPGATVMYWRAWLGDENITKAAKDGFKIIMTPGDPYYINAYEDEDREITPLAYEDMSTLEEVYQYNPIPPGVSGNDVNNILGVQVNLWAEYVINGEVAEYMTFPRVCALAETGWSPGELKDYDDFIRRLKINSKHLDMQHVNYAKYFMNNE